MVKLYVEACRKKQGESFGMKKMKSFYSQLMGIVRVAAFFFLMCSFFLFIWGSLVINKQLQENTKTELLLFAKNCDYNFDSAFNSSMNIRDYIEDNYKESLKNNLRLDNSGNLVGFIDSQCAVMDSVSDIFVYDLNGRVFTKDGIFDEESVYYSYYDVRNNNFEKWHDEIQSLQGMSIGKINTATVLNIFRTEIKTIEYLKYYKVGGQPIVVVYELPLTSFLKGKYSNGNYGIMLSDLEIYPNDDLILSAAQGVKGDNENSIVPFLYNKSLYMMSNYYSNTYSCKYIYVQSYKSYSEYAIEYGGVFFGITLFFLIIALWFSKKSSKRTFEPIKAAIKEISLDNSDGQNEIMNILNYLKENKQEVTNYKGMIEQYNRKMQSVGIEHILTNFIYSPEKADLSDKYKLTFLFDNYYVAVFKIDTENFDSIKEEIEEFLQQLCGDVGIYYDVKIGGILAGVINCNDELCQVFEHKAEILRRNIKEMYGAAIEMAVSYKTTEISEICKKYNACLEEINADEKYKITNQEILNKYSIGKDNMEILSVCIRFGQTDCALLFFDAIGNSQIFYFIETAELKQILYAILSQVLVYHNDTISDLLLDFEKCKKKTDMVEYVRQIIENVSKEHVERIINKRILLQLNVLKYINENIGNQNLSVASIAEKFEMSPSYLSKQFKSLFGIALLEYIQKAKVNEAARLLLYSDMSVNDISNALGFVNTNVFIRLFKKLIGTPPGEFRNTHKDGEK